MENTKIVVSSKAGKKYSADVVVYCIGQRAKDKPDITAEVQTGVLSRACDLGDFKGEENDILVVYDKEGDSAAIGRRTVFIGVGKIKKSIGEEELQEKMRTAGGHIAAFAARVKASKVCVFPPQTLKDSALETAVYGLAEGVMLGDYSFKKYKTRNLEKEQHGGIGELKIVAGGNLQSLRKATVLAKTAAVSACQARDMANEPGNSWTPDSFARFAEELAEKYQLKCTVFDKKQLTRMQMGGILAVNKGSDTPPKLVVLEYNYAEKAKTLLLVGKGLTFDSGGISIKPAAGMEDMKYDMCGGAAVMAVMNAVGAEKPKCNVIAIVPATDNMPGGSALKPADIIRHYNKTTSEIINTDAEGRVILADALAYGIEKYTPDFVIDLATLTGAVIVGLGHHHTGLLSNDDKLADRLILAGKKCGEPLWRLPLGPDYKKQIESKVADIKNTGGKAAGTITAAEYLHTFVGKTPWAHLDIAGTAWGFTEKSYIPGGGPSGICVRTLVEFIRRL